MTKGQFDILTSKELFWEYVPLVCQKARYRVAIRPCSLDNLTEIDTLRELTRLDSAYGTGRPAVLAHDP